MQKKLALWLDYLLDKFVDHFSYTTQNFSYFINLSFSSLNYTASLINPLFLISLITIILIFLRNYWLAGGTFLGLLFIWSMNLWEQAIQTINLVFIASILSIIIGVFLGLLGARYPKFYRFFLEPILDVMQAMPSFVYLIPMIPFFGIGSVAGIFATIIFAMPPVARLTYIGLTNISPEIIEATKAFGSTEFQTFLKVRIPLAIPTIISGINQTIMLAISMIIIAAMVGAGGLGKDVLRAVDRLQFGQGLIAGFAVVIIAMILDRVTKQLSHYYNYQLIKPKKGLKENFFKKILKEDNKQ